YYEVNESLERSPLGIEQEVVRELFNDSVLVVGSTYELHLDQGPEILDRQVRAARLPGPDASHRLLRDRMLEIAADQSVQKILGVILVDDDERLLSFPACRQSAGCVLKATAQAQQCRNIGGRCCCLECVKEQLVSEVSTAAEW